MRFDDDLLRLHASRWLFFADDLRFITACGRAYGASPPSRQHVVSSGFFINLVLRGRGSYTDERGRSYDFEPGCALQFLPGRRYSVSIDPASDYAELYWGSDTKTSEYLVAMGLAHEEPVLRIAVDQELLEEFRALNRQILAQETARDSRLALLRHLAFLESVYARVEQRRPLGRWEKTIREARALIEHDLGSDLDLEAVAKRLEVSYSALRTEFKRAIGVSPGAYRIRKRLEAAQRLLLSASVKQVAKSLGYCDVVAFSKQFKKHVGLSPSHYQRDPGAGRSG